MISLIYWTPYPETWASTRLRMLQFFPYLEARGIRCTLRPFLSPELFNILYKPGVWIKKGMGMMVSLSHRVWDLWEAIHGDALVVHREAILFGPPVLEWITASLFQRILIFDFEDASFTPYDSPIYGRLARWYKWPRKVDELIMMSRMVLAGNPEIERYVANKGRRVRSLPMVVDTDRLTPRSPSERSEVLIGWIGSHSTTRYLDLVMPAIEQLGMKHRIRLRLVGASRPFSIQGIEVENFPWSLERENDYFRDCDIGLFPVADDEWSRGKSGGKAIHYMAAGAPMVASPVGINATLVRDGVNGFLARTSEEWFKYLEVLVEDPQLRRRIGQAGRAIAEAEFSLRIWGPRYVDYIEEALESST